MILFRYLFRELSVAFCLTFAILVFISLVGMTFQSLQVFASLGLDAVGETVPMAIAYLAPWALLVSILLSATLVYGRLAADNEVGAILTAGLHPLRLLVPGTVLALILCAASYFLYAYAAPWAHYQKRLLIRESVLSVLGSPPPGNRTYRFGGFTFNYANVREGKMERLLIIDQTRPRSRVEYTARTGRLEPSSTGDPILVLEDVGRWEERAGEPRPAAGTGTIRLRLTAEEGGRQARNAKDMSLRELRRTMAEARDPHTLWKAQTEYHRRFALSLAPLFLMWVAMPLGVLVPKGSRLAGLGMGFLPLILYLVLALLGQGMGNRGVLPPVPATWLANGAVLLVSIPLLWRVLRR